MGLIKTCLYTSLHLCLCWCACFLPFPLHTYLLLFFHACVRRLDRHLGFTGLVEIDDVLAHAFIALVGKLFFRWRPNISYFWWGGCGRGRSRGRRSSEPKFSFSLSNIVYVPIFVEIRAFCNFGGMGGGSGF